MLFQSKVVLLTGFAPGFGVSLALQAIAQGAQVIATHRLSSEFEEACELVEKAGAGAGLTAIPADLCVRHEVRWLMEQAIGKLGRIDVLINAHSTIGMLSPADTADLEDWRKTFDENFFGPAQLVQELLPHMKQQRSGVIVNVSSQAVRKPLTGHAGFAASKAAFATYTTYLAQELGRYGVRVNTAFVGWMWGPSVAARFKKLAQELGTTVDALKADIVENIALGFIPDNEDCARAVLLLASDFASVVTGATLAIDGGDFSPV